MDPHEKWDDLESWETRLEEKLRQLGTRTPRCSVPDCEETDPFAFTGVHPNILCREHLADAQGRSWLEQHPPPAKSNLDEQPSAPPNDHRALSAAHLRWRRGTRCKPAANPL